ncbi:MAG: biotin/lipoyl-containing protein [Chloroflexota bacterium]|nr:biotin/lipoyl-containing protein [Chloroflexota bacterium]
MKMRVEIDGQVFEVDIQDLNARPVIAQVDGERFEVWPEEAAPAAPKPAASPIMAAPEPVTTSAAPEAAPAAKVMPAPLPGVIVAIAVKPGDKVSTGQELCTLEAMKMKNAIRSGRDGVIATVEVDVGQQVNHGQVLMTFSD